MLLPWSLVNYFTVTVLTVVLVVAFLIFSSRRSGPGFPDDGLEEHTAGCRWNYESVTCWRINVASSLGCERSAFLFTGK